MRTKLDRTADQESFTLHNKQTWAITMHLIGVSLQVLNAFCIEITVTGWGWGLVVAHLHVLVWDRCGHFGDPLINTASKNIYFEVQLVLVTIINIIALQTWSSWVFWWVNYASKKLLKNIKTDIHRCSALTEAAVQRIFPPLKVFVIWLLAQ